MLSRQALEKDILILVLRLLGEDPDTFSPEVLEVMKRWRKKTHSVLKGEYVYENDEYYDFYDSIDGIIVEGNKRFMTKIEIYDAIEKEWEKAKK